MKRLLKRGLRRAGYRLERVRPRKGIERRQPKDLPQLEHIDVRFRSGEWHYSVPMADLVGRPCFGYGSNSWHPFVATVRELLEDPSVEYADSVLRKFYSKWQPASIADAQFPGREPPHEILNRIPSNTLFEPWLLRPPPCDNPLNPDCQPSGAPLHGPVSPDEGHVEFSRLREMIASIEAFGYLPSDFPKGLIAVGVLRYDGRQRFLVTHGQHRTAVLSALGEESIEVGIHSGIPAVIDAEDVESWPHVVSGLIPADVALQQLARYFPENRAADPGWELGRRVEGASEHEEASA